ASPEPSALVGFAGSAVPVAALPAVSVFPPEPESGLGDSFGADSAFGGSGLAVIVATIASEHFIPRATSTGAMTIPNTPATSLTIMLFSAGFSSCSSLAIAASPTRTESLPILANRFPVRATSKLQVDEILLVSHNLPQS